MAGLWWFRAVSFRELLSHGIFIYGILFYYYIWCRFFAIGTSYSWGIIQSHLVKDGLGSPSTLAFVGSTTAACIAVLAIVNAKLVRVLGARYLGLVGAMLLGAGGILSSWSTQNVGGLFVTTGIIMGVGLTLYFMVGLAEFSK